MSQSFANSLDHMARKAAKTKRQYQGIYSIQVNFFLPPSPSRTRPWPPPTVQSWRGHKQKPRKSPNANRSWKVGRPLFPLLEVPAHLLLSSSWQAYSVALDQTGKRGRAARSAGGVAVSRPPWCHWTTRDLAPTRFSPSLPSFLPVPVAGMGADDYSVHGVLVASYKRTVRRL